MDEIERLKQAIAALEVQRPLLGDEVVETGLAVMRARLEHLQAQEKVEQRKLLTVLFADLVGFTALSEQMDPEDVREVTQAYFKRWTGAIGGLGGEIEKFIGDAVMAVFGLTTAREDDPENAIRAALAMKSELEDLNDELEVKYGIRLKMRVGIHTGIAVVGALAERSEGSQEQEISAVGDTVNVASRLQTAAPENGILISFETYRHVRGIFEVQALDPIQVKGKKEPIQVSLVLAAKPRAFRMITRGIEGVEARLVGRDAEMHSLQSALKKVLQEGQRQMVTVIGDAGIGKSRLLNEFDDWVEFLPEEVFYFKGRANPVMQNQAYSLLRDLLSSRFRIQDNDSLEAVREKMVHEIGNEENAIRIGQLIGFDTGHSEPGRMEQDPKQVRDLALEALRSFFQDLSGQDAVVFLLEDLHWADDSSLDVIEWLAKMLAHCRVFFLCATRPTLFESRPGWGEGQEGFQRLTLQPLSEGDSRQLVVEILQRIEDLPASLRDLIVQNAEGNPFYIEELIKVLIEDRLILRGEEQWSVDASQLENLRIPPTLTGVLQARLDSLPPAERALLQRAAVIGRTFWDQALEWLFLPSAGDEMSHLRKEDQITAIRASLEELRRHEMVYKNPESAFESAQEYLFKHTLLRDVTYESLLKRVRRGYHARAARWLEMATQSNARTEQYAASISEHYRLAGETSLAIDWYQRAGEFAARHFAHTEAVRCFSLCLEMLGDTDLVRRFDLLQSCERVYDLQGERQLQEQGLNTLEDLASRLEEAGLGEGGEAMERKAEVELRRAALRDVTGNYPEAIAHAQKAANLANGSGDVRREARAYLIQGSALHHSTDYPNAYQVTKRALVLAQSTQMPDLEADSLWMLGVIADFSSRYPEARGYLEAALAIYRALGNRRGESTALNSLGTVAYHQGHYSETRAYYDQALGLKKELGDRYGEGILLNNLGIIADQHVDIQASREYFEQCLRICEEIEDAEGQAGAYNGLGSAAGALGDYDTARDYQEQALRIYRAIGDREGENIVLSGMSQMALDLGQPDVALEYARQARQIAHEIGELGEESLAYIFTGNALLALGRLDEARGAFQLALHICQDLSHVDRTIWALAGLAGVALSRREFEAAGGFVDEILKLQALYGVEEDLRNLRVSLVCYRVLRAMGDPRADEVLRVSYQTLQKRASRIVDGKMRRSFLENVPANRELVSLWESQSIFHG